MFSERQEQGHAPASPANSFAQLFLSQDDQFVRAPTPLADITTTNQNKNKRKVPPKKIHKQTRLLLDARTELTDEELKVGIPSLV